MCLRVDGASIFNLLRPEIVSKTQIFNYIFFSEMARNIAIIFTTNVL